MTNITYGYDPLYCLISATYSSGQVCTYTYDAVGNRLILTTNVHVVNYGYDDANRLTSVNGQAYTWDDSGNLLHCRNCRTHRWASNKKAPPSWAGLSCAESVQLLQGLPKQLLDLLRVRFRRQADGQGIAVRLHVVVPLGLASLDGLRFESTDDLKNEPLGQFREPGKLGSNPVNDWRRFGVGSVEAGQGRGLVGLETPEYSAKTLPFDSLPSTTLGTGRTLPSVPPPPAASP